MDLEWVESAPSKVQTVQSCLMLDRSITIATQLLEILVGLREFFMGALNLVTLMRNQVAL